LGRPPGHARRSALHWLRDATDLPTPSAQARALLKRIPDPQPILDDLADGMATLPAWMQDLLKPIVAKRTLAE
jgi:hypothetical protein